MALLQAGMDDIMPLTSSATPARPTAAVRPAPELSIIVPTFNERTNVPLLVERLERLLAAYDWEVVFVDDNSPDGTAAAARAIGEGDSRVRCIRRIGRRGLAGACLEGMLASQARYVAVMDADLQHDESLLLDSAGAFARRARRPRRRQPLSSRRLGGGTFQAALAREPLVERCGAPPSWH
jgi:glycosyltransferase involved in cell wall biosynthesis